MTINEFAQRHFAYNRISITRRRRVLKELMAFERFVGGDIRQATADDLRLWMSELLSTTGLNVNTVVLNGKIVRCYFRVAWEAGDIDSEMLMRVRAVKNPRGSTSVGKPRPYTATEIDRLFQQVDAAWPRDKTGVRVGKWMDNNASYGWFIYRHLMNVQLRTIIALALDAGLRRREIFEATVNDLHPDNTMVVVRRGKSPISDEPRYREVPYTVNLRAIVSEWLAIRGRMRIGHDRAWIIGTPGVENRHSLNGVIRYSSDPMRFRRFAMLLTELGEGWEFHRLRHTAATMWLRAGVPLEVVSKMLGHSNITQTLVYAKLVRSDVERHMHEREAHFEKLLHRRTPGVEAPEGFHIREEAA